MPDEIRDQVGKLPKLPTAKLKTMWEDLFAKPAHPKMRRELMIPVLAYRLQEQAYGGLSQQTLTKLRQLARDLERNPKAVARLRRIKPGTRIIRQWDGDTHEVTVVRDGYSYRGKHYVSLSAIARKITGTRWSGPLFFGLRPSQKAED